MKPAYLNLPPGALDDKVRQSEAILKSCVLCPRECRVDRTSGEAGFCKTGDQPYLSSWGPHFGEERPLVGKYGSGTIFFSYCNLGCLYCQNYTISHLGEGNEVSYQKLASIMIDLQVRGCHNINLVTPTHQTPMFLRALSLAISEGLRIPIVYNCGGYESQQTLSLLDGVIDIYMPDFKYTDPEQALRYSHASAYPAAAESALKEMHRQVGDLVLDECGVARRGLLVRHLVLPEGIAGTKGVVEFIAREISKDTYINIMDQYHPCYLAYDHRPLHRRITAKEYAEAVKLALEAGLSRLD